MAIQPSRRTTVRGWPGAGKAVTVVLPVLSYHFEWVNVVLYEGGENTGTPATVSWDTYSSMLRSLHA